MICSEDIVAFKILFSFGQFIFCKHCFHAKNVYYPLLSNFAPKLARPFGKCTFGHATVAVWTQKKFFPLLTRPQGSQGCQKITFYFLKMKLFSFCAKIALKRHKLQKPSKLKKKCQKKPVFLDFFEYSSI